MRKKLVIIGASGRGKVIADIAEKNGYEEIVFLDDDTSLKKCGCYSVVGTSENIMLYQEYDFVVGIGNSKERKKIQNRIECLQLPLAVLVHPNAVIADDVFIGNGTVVMAGAVINPGTVIGRGCIINTCASVDHDCSISDFVHVSVGSHIAGTVNIGQKTWIGAGAIVSNNLFICDECYIGAGGVVVRDIEEAGTYIGVPVRKLSIL